MQAEIKKEILEILSKAMIRETSSFNYYYKGSENPITPPTIKALLSRLAEEERVHRRLLLNEYRAIEKSKEAPEENGEEEAMAYSISGELSINDLGTDDTIEGAYLCIPSRFVGGDNIHTETIGDRGSGTRGTLLYIYDVMGHGPAAAGLNAFAARIVGEYLEGSGPAGADSGLISPGRIVGLINSRMNKKYEGSGIFLTMLCVFFDSREGMLSFTCAGHEPPFLVDKKGQVSSLLQTQLIVGIDADFRYREHSIPFGGGDILCSFSDGIIEARNEAGEIFGRKRVASLLERNRGGSPADIIEAIIDGVKDHVKERPLEDDISVVIMKSKGA